MKEQKAKSRSQQHEIEINASPEAVWRAITDADELARWFAEEARVTPGEGGKIWISWGEGQDGTSLIEVWEPGKKLRLALQNDPNKCGPVTEQISTTPQSPMIDEYTIETRDGRTVLRLVNSGIPDSPDWEAYYDGTNRGWDMFFIGLRHYLENHAGKARSNILFMQPIQGTIEDAWTRITGPEGLDSQSAIANVKEGERFQATTSMGDELAGEVIMNVPPKTLVATVENLNNALLSVTFEQMQGMSFIYLTLATFGLESEALSSLQERWTLWLGELFPAPQMPQPTERSDEMKKIFMLIVATIISIATLSADVAAQEKMSAEEKAKRMADYYAIAGPGPEHKQLESRVGAWNQEVKYWIDRDKPPMTIAGTCESRMIMGGRFLLNECKSSAGGMTVENNAVIGFDRRHKRFTIVAFDSTATYYVAAAGPYDEARKAIVMSGEDDDPVLGGKQIYDFVIRDFSPDRYVSEVIFKDEAHTQGKGDFKMVEVTLTRAKKEMK